MVVVKGIIRLQSDNITNKLSLIPLIVTHLTSPVEELHAGHPFIDGEFVFARVVVDVAD